MQDQELDDWQPNRVSLEELLEIIKTAESPVRKRAVQTRCAGRAAAAAT